MKKKKRCPTCGKKMFFCKESKDFVCRRCGYPDTEKTVAWQKHHQETQRARKIYRIVLDRITGRKKLFMAKEMPK